MKNQYFGDVYDYLKYSLLRHLTGRGQIHSAICWMLTENDSRHDGHRVEYLYQDDSWSQFDPSVYSFLQEQVLVQKSRVVKAVEDSSVLANSRFYSGFLDDDACERPGYFSRFLEFARGASLVFFDPDNGIEVKSVKYGKRASSKYLFWVEIVQTFAAGHSVLIYQHLPPKPRDAYIGMRVSEISQATGASIVYSFNTSRVVFFLIPQEVNLPFFQEAVEGAKEAWAGVAQVRQHSIDSGL